MPRYTLKYLPEVHSQIREAIAKTRLDYGEAKALEYSQLILRTLRDLTQNPFVRPLHPEIHPDARIMHIRRSGHRAAHLFLYRVRGDVVELARFRYDAMDLESQVPSEWKRQ